MINLNDIQIHPDIEIAKQHIDGINTNNTDTTFVLQDPFPFAVKQMLMDYFNDYVEIGSNNALQTCLILQSKYGKKHLCVDPFHRLNTSSQGVQIDLEKIFMNKLQSMNIFDHEIDLLQCDYNDEKTVAEVRNKTHTISMLSIDSVHSYEGILRVFSLYSPLVEHGGIIIVHGYDHPDLPEVKHGVDTIDKRAWHIIGQHGSTFYMQKK